nr:hypothetical protein [uncultured Dyadobacter sp.]
MPKKHSLFCKSIFGREYTKIVGFWDLASDEFCPPEIDEIMTIVLPLGKHNDLICNGNSSFMGRVDENENQSKIAISARSRKEGERLFEGLCPGGNFEGHSAKVRGEPRQACSATGTGFSGLPCLTV